MLIRRLFLLGTVGLLAAAGQPGLAQPVPAEAGDPDARCLFLMRLSQLSLMGDGILQEAELQRWRGLRIAYSYYAGRLSAHRDDAAMSAALELGQRSLAGASDLDEQAQHCFDGGSSAIRAVNLEIDAGLPPQDGSAPATPASPATPPDHDALCMLNIRAAHNSMRSQGRLMPNQAQRLEKAFSFYGGRMQATRGAGGITPLIAAAIDPWRNGALPEIHACLDTAIEILDRTEGTNAADGGPAAGEPDSATSAGNAKNAT